MWEQMAVGPVKAKADNGKRARKTEDAAPISRVRRNGLKSFMVGIYRQMQIPASIR